MKRALVLVVLVILCILLAVTNVYLIQTRNISEAESVSYGPPIPPSKKLPPTRTRTRTHHRVAGLSCKLHGGPSDESAAEMIYWRDITADATFISPFQNTGPSPKYLTFEPDEGGFNNVRMATETAIALAISMGRILVLPPETHFYLLSKRHNGEKKTFTVSDFFHLDSVEAEHNSKSFQTISMEEFLKREALQGNIRNTTTGSATFPPDNRTDWNGIGFNWDAASGGVGSGLWKWLRQAAVALDWEYLQCVAAFPNGPDSKSLSRLESAIRQILDEDKTYEAGESAAAASNTSIMEAWKKRAKSFDGHPTPVDASVTDRLREMLADRKGLCIYNETLQQTKVIHLKGDQLSGHRILVHFYAFLFFEDWRQDLWMKRFVRDHLRYNDLIQCAAARVVQAVREAARQHGSNGTFDSLHVRHGDFEYKDMNLPAEELYANLRSFIREKRTLFVATDERNTSYFDPLREHYHIYELRDFEHLLVDVNKNYFGMIDQLVASRGDTFVGTYFSTFSSYINRLKGYHSQNKKTFGYEHGIIRSFYYAPKKRRKIRRVHRTYRSLRPNFWQEEFAAGWRMIDYDLIK